MSCTLAEISEITGSVLHGDSNKNITGVATLQNAGAGDLSFLANRRYVKYLETTRAAAVILAEKDMDKCPVDVLVAENPYLAFVRAVRHFHPDEPVTAGISASATIARDARVDPSAWIGPGVVIGGGAEVGAGSCIGPGCVIGDAVRIGAHTRLVANVTVCAGVSIGSRVILHPGVVIGADGFGIVNDGKGWLKIPQIGSVQIGDDVEIGANTTIDRGALNDTVIEDGVKIDNQVQIGHNVRIGAHTAIAGCVAVAGSVTIGRRCMIGGLSALSGHIEIADDVVIHGMTGVANSITQPGQYGSSLPAIDSRLWKKNVARFKHLDDLVRRLQELEAKINQ